MKRILILLAASALIAADEAPSPVGPADLDRLADITEPVFTPDGAAVLYTLTTRDTALDTMFSDLWSAAWQGSTPRQLTRTPRSSEWQAAPSADGRTIYFLSDAAKDQSVQLWAIPAKGGKARQITRVEGGISDFALSADGRRAVVVAEVDPTPPPKHLGKPEDAPRAKPPIVIDRFKFREDERDWIEDTAAQLHLVDLRQGTASQLTNLQFDAHAPAWSPDGSQIAFVSWRDAAADRTGDSDIFVITPQAGAAPRAVSTSRNADNDPGGVGGRPAWSPDSRRLAWLTAGEAKWIYYSPSQLSMGDLASGTVREVARIDRWTESPRWSSDGSRVLAMVEQDRTKWLASIDPDADTVTYLTSGASVTSAFAIGPAGRIAVLEGDDTRPEVLRRIDGANTVLADHNPWLRARRLGEVREVSYASTEGSEIRGLITLPATGSHAPGVKPALIVRIHGGPVSQFDHSFNLDAQIYAAQGFAVLTVNPRGSSGRGFDFARAIYADWGNKDAADISAGISWALDQGLADPGRVAVGGWSYGGILTNYLIASDSRIKAAVSGAGVSNIFGLWGVDQYIREYEQELGTPWDKPENYARVSYPFFLADQIKTPTLFLCSEADHNVPCAGSQQMYQALKTTGVPTRLVIYPDASHSLTAPSHLRDRIERSLAWYDQHLNGK